VTEIEHSLERGQLAVDRSVGCACFLALVDVFVEKDARYLSGLHPSKERLQVEPPSRLCVIERAPAVDLVVANEVFRQFRNSSLLWGELGNRASCQLCDPKFQLLQSFLSVRSLRGFPSFDAILVILQPPNRASLGQEDSPRSTLASAHLLFLC
jgi:hypothetical protein